MAHERLVKMHAFRRAVFNGDKKARAALERKLGRERKSIEKRLEEALRAG